MYPISIRLDLYLINSVYMPGQQHNLNKYSESGDSDKSYSEIEEESDMRLYAAQIDASEGFDVGDFPKLKEVMYGMVVPLSNPNDISIVRESAEFALEEYNKDNPTKHHLVEILKTNAAASGGMTFYITFEADDDYGNSKTFQSEVFYGIPDEDGNPDIEVCNFRIKSDSQLKVAAASEESAVESS
ncbi:hypothetical protein LguiA_036519 [Lonicera macranthoides]